jgi:hypothetical protein
MYSVNFQMYLLVRIRIYGIFELIRMNDNSENFKILLILIQRKIIKLTDI